MKSIVDPVVWRPLLPGQVSQIRVLDVDSLEVSVVFETDKLVVEAPNWSRDGTMILVNAAGALYRWDFGGDLTPIGTPGLDDHNNDHLLSPDGRTIYSSSEGTGHLFAIPVEGGEAKQLSEDREGTFSYFIQGLSADGLTLGFAGARPGPHGEILTELFTMPTAGGPATQLSDWGVPSVGVEFAPDGGWLYFNSELGASHPGHAQVFRIRPDGTNIEQLTHDENVNWFPKPSPDGSVVAYLAFAPGTMGHEANVPVSICLMDPDGSNQRVAAELFGGQGTLNVNGWSADGRRLAFMAYPVLAYQDGAQDV